MNDPTTADKGSESNIFQAIWRDLENILPYDSPAFRQNAEFLESLRACNYPHVSLVDPNIWQARVPKVSPTQRAIGTAQKGRNNDSTTRSLPHGTPVTTPTRATALIGPAMALIESDACAFDTTDNAASISTADFAINVSLDSVSARDLPSEIHVNTSPHTPQRVLARTVAAHPIGEHAPDDLAISIRPTVRSPFITNERPMVCKPQPGCPTFGSNWTKSSSFPSQSKNDPPPAPRRNTIRRPTKSASHVNDTSRASRRSQPYMKPRPKAQPGGVEHIPKYTLKSTFPRLALQSVVKSTSTSGDVFLNGNQHVRSPDMQSLFRPITRLPSHRTQCETAFHSDDTPHRKAASEAFPAKQMNRPSGAHGTRPRCGAGLDLGPSTPPRHRKKTLVVPNTPKGKTRLQSAHPLSAVAGATQEVLLGVANKNGLKCAWSPVLLEKPVEPTESAVHQYAYRPSSMALIDSPPSPPRKRKALDTETETPESPSQKRTRRGIHRFSPPCLKDLADPFDSAPTNFSINEKHIRTGNPGFSPPCVNPFVDPFDSAPTTVSIDTRRARSTKARPDAPRKSNVRTVPSVVASGVQKSRQTNGTPRIESTGKQAGNPMGLPKREVNPHHVDLGEHLSVTDSRVAQSHRNKLLGAASRQTTAEIRARNIATASDLFPPIDDVFIVDQFGRRVRKTLKPRRKAFQVYRDPASTNSHKGRSGN
jgi:hypothetical protein